MPVHSYLELYKKHINLNLSATCYTLGVHVVSTVAMMTVTVAVAATAAPSTIEIGVGREGADGLDS